jgi:hypothetical protein
MFKQVILLLLMLFSVNLNAQFVKQDKLDTDWKFNINLFKRTIPFYFNGSMGVSHGPEHIYGLPIINLALQSHHKKGVYFGEQGGTIVGFTASHGLHTGIGYKWFTFDYGQTRFQSEKLKCFTNNFKAGINISYVWLKFGPSIRNNDPNYID